MEPRGHCWNTSLPQQWHTALLEHTAAQQRSWVSATMTYVRWRERHLWNIIALEFCFHSWTRQFPNKNCKIAVIIPSQWTYFTDRPKPKGIKNAVNRTWWWRQQAPSITSVSFYQTTRRNNPEDSRLHTRRRKNLKSQWGLSWFLNPCRRLLG
jgi:hypothetical protein